MHVLKPPDHTVFNKRHESLLAVLVLYEKEIESAESLSTLVSLLRDSLNDKLVLSHILIYDNSEKRHQSNLTHSVSGVTYFHNPHNGGTVAAYSYAFELAKVIGANWILLLDHDTVIPLNHLSLAANKLNNLQDSNIAALVPVVKHGDTIVSPAFLNKYGSVVPCEDVNGKKFTDICTAISSGVLINTEALKDIMPFPKELWLDYVDHWMFLSFFRSKWNVLSFESIIGHHLSIEAPSELGARRLTSILNGEAVFLSLMGGLAKKTYYLRIAYRVLKYLRLNPRLVPPMLRWLVCRIQDKSK